VSAPHDDTAASILARYAQGQRTFHDISPEEDGLDFSNAQLDDVRFERCFLHSSSFRCAPLVNAVFCDCNVKCCDFRGADLRNARFTGSLVEAIDLQGARLEGASFVGARAYGYELRPGDMP
jgi:uncharacterized protein YjbI with pentapeptide repeats